MGCAMGSVALSSRLENFPSGHNLEKITMHLNVKTNGQSPAGFSGLAIERAVFEKPSEIRRIAFLGDYLPRKCGIATFTADVRSAVAARCPRSQCFAVPVNDIAGGYDYPGEVLFEIEEQDLPSYLRAADFLNISNTDLVSLQHEFGIFGGPSGGHVLALLRELRMPIVTTLHTVLAEPNTEQRRVMQELIARSTRLIVM